MEVAVILSLDFLSVESFTQRRGSAPKRGGTTIEAKMRFKSLSSHLAIQLDKPVTQVYFGERHSTFLDKYNKLSVCTF